MDGLVLRRGSSKRTRRALATLKGGPVCFMVYLRMQIAK
jgi:hypothetical protein